MVHNALPVAVGFLAVYLSVPVFREIAFIFKVVDAPGGRKIHRAVTPLFGGIAIYCGLIVALLFSSVDLMKVLPVLSGATIILVVGLVDDIRGLSAQSRLLWQVMAASAVIFTGNHVDFMPDTFAGNCVEYGVTYLWLVGVTNAFNYLDGMDGLAAGSAVLNLCFFGAILLLSVQQPLGLFSLILAACCMGFLPYNFRSRKIFLGDAGSTFLGFVLAGIALVGHWAQDDIVKISIPVIILGVPIFDMIFTTVMRIKEGKVRTVAGWLRYAGRDHFHHYLVDIGLHPSQAVVFIYCVTLSLGISAVMVSNDRAIEALLAIGQSVIIFGMVATLMVVGKRRRSGWRRVRK
ncbi:MAG: undecaprenyl/decaprenyl-phosphate alpha-N-acetylglucosaminyl 1-phosphate transferase [Candidatus Omnitrophica bacterium]|nr:undecaprenyl/decaprenyl-phosphate alpha-N-acetylglucosaminyl 1-phosphate transferase [Candidatus Omnitrophota bacterium]